jgi:Brp/Blh family beta-carotene 15,15'-monooxygenase
VYLLVLGITLATIGLSLVASVTLSQAEIAVLIGVVLLLGIPHGAVDHLVAKDLYALQPHWLDQTKFYAGYLLAMGVYGGLWYLFPAPALLLFLGFAVYHFGQSDLEYLGLQGERQTVLDVSRGLLLIGLPLVAHLEVVAPIFERIAGLNPLAWPILADYAWLWTTILIAQHVVLFFALAAPRVLWADLLREGVTIAVLSVLFVLVNPLVAFAVYFGFWHSLGHILELLRYFNRRGRQMTLVGFYRHAALFTVISILGLAGLYLTAGAFGLREHMISLLFILISLLTLPHMVIVEKFWQARA